MIKLTENELKEARKIEASTRYEALDKLADVLDAKTTNNFRWARCSRCITSDGCKINITTKKDKKSGFIKIVSIDVFGVNKEWDTYNLYIE